MRMKAWRQFGTAIEAAVLHAELKAALANLVTGMEERIATGSYGHCLNCSNPISPERLRALPWAEFCTTCEDASLTRERVQSPAPLIPDLRRQGR